MKLSDTFHLCAVAEDGDRGVRAFAKKEIEKFVKKFVQISDCAIYDHDAEHTLKVLMIIETLAGDIHYGEEILTATVSSEISKWIDEVLDFCGLEMFRRYNSGQQKGFGISGHVAFFMECEDEIDGGLTVRVGRKDWGTKAIHFRNTRRSVLRGSEKDPELSGTR